MTPERLDEILKGIAGASVAVVGDFCLDAYWILDDALSERSVETGKPTVPVRSQYYSLGGAGNIAANLAALGAGRVFAIGVIGDDLFGRELVRQLESAGVDASGLCVQRENWATHVYGKPYARDEEQSRIDLGVRNALSSESEKAVLAAIESAVSGAGAVIINQQLRCGIASDAVVEGINKLAETHKDKHLVADSRNQSERFRNCIYRFNAHEAARLCGHDQPFDQNVRLDDVLSFAARIFGDTGKPVFISRGERGAVVHWDGGTETIPGIQIMGRTDAVGAGDTSVSAIAAALAAGASAPEAAELANFASAVTVQKIRTTGTAGPDEIRRIASTADFIYRPELAADPRAARCLAGSEIEIVGDAGPRGRVRHALFDHDGTISTLRQGWEPIMEEVFIRCILGPVYDTADESVYRRVADRVRRYIVRSTGIQTLKQMKMLVEMVVEFGYVPPDRILGAHEYKRAYLDALMGRVRARVEKLGRAELDTSDLTVKGSIAFLNMLKQRGVRLYLASGTDEADVKREAEFLGYAGLFDGGIFGATEDADHDVKRQVVERILTAHGLSGPELVCFGDGPVELRETKRHGGIAVGVASDEVRRHGLNQEKRTRLICAGADIVVPDFSQGSALLKYLFEPAGR